MLKTAFISSVAAAALAISGAAFAQSSSGAGATPPVAPSPNANPKASGQAPGLQNNQTGAPRGAAGSERAQERTGSPAATTSDPKGASAGQTSPKGAAGDNVSTGRIPQVQITEQQRTQLRTRVREANIRTLSRDQIKVSIAVGSILPSTVTFVPLPDPIVTLVPAFRGYHAVRVGDQVLIVEPGTRRIVYIIEA